MRWIKIVTRFSEASVRRSSAPYYEPEIHNTDGTVPADAGIRVTEGIELPSAKLELINYFKKETW